MNQKRERKEKKELTNSTALKTFKSNAALHSSALESPTFFTGSNAP